MDPLKEAFNKIKQEITFLKNGLTNLEKGVLETRERMTELYNIVGKINKKVESLTSTHNSKISTNINTNTTDNYPLKALKPHNLGISIGNKGVSTDRQTDRQTHRQTQNLSKNNPDSFKNALETLNFLDNIKKEIRLKFKRLTEQEVVVFSTIYQIEEEKGYTDYRQIATKLNLTESSVRDYVGRLIKKGIPIEKKKINNKQIHLFISPDLKKIASLSTILQLRDL